MDGVGGRDGDLDGGWLAIAIVAPGRDEGMTRRSTLVLGVALALAAGFLQAAIATHPTNDDFQHLVLAQQLRAGDWPIRDFYDTGLGLMYVLSAALQSLVGEALAAEAIIVAVAMAVTTYLVFRLVLNLTHSTTAAALAALVLVVAGPRGYSYPKFIVYAVASTLWWAYVHTPNRARALALGAWTAIAFYWRADHGVYVAIGSALAFLSAHGLRPMAVRRSFESGALALALIVPFLIYSVAVGGTGYVRSGFVLANAQHTQLDSHTWPKWPIREAGDVFRREDESEYAPVVGLRWSESSSPDARQALLAQYGLQVLSTEGRSVQVRLSRSSLERLRSLVNEPIVEDTAGIERGSGTVAQDSWSSLSRQRFEHTWLRFRVLAGVDEQERAGEAVGALFYLMPVLLLGSLVLLPRTSLPEATPRGALAAFAIFAIVTDIGLMRSPYYVRAVDGAVLSAILFGICVAALLSLTSGGSLLRRAALVVVVAAFTLVMVKSVAVAGEFGNRVSLLAGEWRSSSQVGRAWLTVWRDLLADPPISQWDGRGPSVSIQLARYVRACVPQSDRLLVLWFAPEIYYYSDRLMAGRHLVFVQGYQELGVEQQLALAKVERYAPPIALANGALDGFTHDVYPRVVDYVRREYDVVGSLENDGERYTVLGRRDRRATSWYGESKWPCYA
jgi:hypothetical protein